MKNFAGKSPGTIKLYISSLPYFRYYLFSAQVNSILSSLYGSMETEPWVTMVILLASLQLLLPHTDKMSILSPGIVVMKFVCRVYTFYPQDYKKLYLAQVYQNGRQNKSLYL